jgi:hypothetical protein
MKSLSGQRHIARPMTTGQTMNQKYARITGLPTLGAIIMNRDLVAIGQANQVGPGR